MALYQAHLAVAPAGKGIPGRLRRTRVGALCRSAVGQLPIGPGREASIPRLSRSGGWPLDQREVGVRLLPIEHDLGTVGRNVEVANHEVRRQYGERPLGARAEIEQPQVFVANLAAENHEPLRVVQKRDAARAAGENDARQWIRPTVRSGCPQREGRTDIRARLHEKPPIW